MYYYVYFIDIVILCEICEVFFYIYIFCYYCMYYIYLCGVIYGVIGVKFRMDLIFIYLFLILNLVRKKIILIGIIFKNLIFSFVSVKLVYFNNRCLRF